MRPEVDQVAAFEGDGSIIAGRRVMEPVQLNEGINLVRVEKVIIQVKAAKEVVAALAIHADGEAGGVQEIHTAETRSPKILAEAEIRNQRQAAGILKHFAGPRRNGELQAAGQERASVLGADEGILRP